MAKSYGTKDYESSYSAAEFKRCGVKGDVPKPKKPKAVSASAEGMALSVTGGDES